MYSHFLDLCWPQLCSLILLVFGNYLSSLCFLQKLQDYPFSQDECQHPIMLQSFPWPLTDVYHHRCPSDLIPGFFESIRTLPSLTSTIACVSPWISYLPFQAMLLLGVLVDSLELPKSVLSSPHQTPLVLSLSSTRAKCTIVNVTMHLRENRANSDPTLPLAREGVPTYKCAPAHIWKDSNYLHYRGCNCQWDQNQLSSGAASLSLDPGSNQVSTPEEKVKLAQNIVLSPQM